MLVSLIHFSPDFVFLSGAESSDHVLVGVSIVMGNGSDGCSLVLSRTDSNGILIVTRWFVIALRFTVYIKPVGWSGTVHGMKVMVAYGILCHLLFMLKNIRPFWTQRKEEIMKTVNSKK